MIDFYKTRMGERFYTSTMPRIAKALERIADSLEVNKYPVDYPQDDQRDG